MAMDLTPLLSILLDENSVRSLDRFTKLYDLGL